SDERKTTVADEKTTAEPLIIFDKESLLERLMGDEEFVHEVIEGYLEDIPKRIKALKDCLEKGDLKGAELQAHTIKGASANLSGEAVREIAAVIEKACKAGGKGPSQSDLSNLEVRYVQLKLVLQKELRKKTNK
ncbi:MAG: Hpt domain-containing protein, partial [Chloroflexi bacterium]|nr:Hpt domain-containing protein [Chloroflexota bacterium]